MVLLCDFALENLPRDVYGELRRLGFELVQHALAFGNGLMHLVGENALRVLLGLFAEVFRFAFGCLAAFVLALLGRERASDPESSDWE